MGEQPVPKANAMLICDSVITDKATNKKSLIGVFENINASKFPCAHHSLAIYIKLTDARGKYKFRLELVDLEENLIIGKTELPQDISINNPLGTYELVINFGGLTFKHAGEYDFRMFANNKIFEQKKFSVKQIQIKKLPEKGY